MGSARVLVVGMIGLIAWVKPARAQEPPSVSIHDGPVGHSLEHGTRPSTQLNLADCRLDDQLAFPVRLSGSVGYRFEIWAGIGCDMRSARTAAQQLKCWQLSSNAASDGALDVALPVKDVLYGRTLAADPTLGPKGKPAELDAKLACQDPIENPVPQLVTVYFMLVDDSEDVVGTFVTNALSYELTRPVAPDRIDAIAGPEQLTIQFGYDSPSPDTTITGYDFFCDPELGSHPEQPSSADPGACSPSSVLVPGTDSDLLAEHRCGSAGPSASSTVIAPLAAGISVAVAVSTVDSYSNQSTLSRVTCGVPANATPEPEGQRAAACSLAFRRESLPLVSSLCAISLLVIRRRRHRISATVAKP